HQGTGHPRPPARIRAGAVVDGRVARGGDDAADRLRERSDRGRGDRAGEIARVDRSIDLDPFNLALHMQRAHLLYDAGRYAQALKEIQFVRQHTNEKIEGIDELEQQAKQRRIEEIARLDERMKL